MAGDNLQRDIELIEGLLRECGSLDDGDAWQRLKPRLTPDRERVARAICATYWHGIYVDEMWESYLKEADAAIAAMKETP